MGYKNMNRQFKTNRRVCFLKDCGMKVPYATITAAGWGTAITSRATQALTDFHEKTEFGLNRIFHYKHPFSMENSSFSSNGIEPQLGPVQKQSQKLLRKKSFSRSSKCLRVLKKCPHSK